MKVKVVWRQQAKLPEHLGHALVNGKHDGNIMSRPEAEAYAERLGAEFSAVILPKNDPDSPVMHQRVNAERAEELRQLAKDVRAFARGLDTTAHSCERCSGKRYNNFTEAQHAKELEAMAGKLDRFSNHYGEKGRPLPKCARKGCRKLVDDPTAHYCGEECSKADEP